MFDKNEECESVKEFTCTDEWELSPESAPPPGLYNEFQLVVKLSSPQL